MPIHTTPVVRGGAGSPVWSRGLQTRGRATTELTMLFANLAQALVTCNPPPVHSRRVSEGALPRSAATRQPHRQRRARRGRGQGHHAHPAPLRQHQAAKRCTGRHADEHAGEE